MYDGQSLHHLPGDAALELLRETHAALIGLLWQIEDYRNFDDSAVESHFDDTVPMERAEYIHRILMTKTPKSICERGYFRGEGREEFMKWVDRCRVADSFAGAKDVFSIKADQPESEA